MKNVNLNKVIVNIMIALNLKSGEKDYKFMIAYSSMTISLYLYLIFFNLLLVFELLGTGLFTLFMQFYDSTNSIKKLSLAILFYLIVCGVLLGIVKKEVGNLNETIKIENIEEYREISSIVLLFGFVMILFLILLLELVFK